MIKDNLHPNIVDDMDRPVNHTLIPVRRVGSAEPVEVETSSGGIHITRRGKLARGAGVLAATGMALTLGVQAGVHEFNTMKHNKQVSDDYEKANKVITYNSPDNPNDAPSTRYSHRLPGSSPTDIPGMKPAGH